MDSEKCRALIAAIDEGSMAAAGARLGYTPSGVARMVNSLEAEVGVPLLARTPRGVTPTSDGAALLPAIRDVAQAAERVAQSAAAARGLELGELRVASYSSIAATWLPRALSRFNKSYPHIRVITQEAGNEQLIEWVEQRKVDCALLAKRPFRGDWIDLAEDRLLAWLPKSHPLARADAFPIEQLEGTPFVDVSPHQDTDIAQLLATERVTPDIRCSTTSSYTAYRLVEAGLGISINNELMSKGWTGGVATLPLDPPRSVRLGIAVPSLERASLACQKFIEIMKECARSK